ncbi:class I SAM-dependent methyltransferase [bacterium]|nr:class I SAM-dependent methyltransferase [bacterium]
MNDTCVLCHSEKYRVLSTKLRHDRPGTVVECTDCGLARIQGATHYAAKLNEFYKEQYSKDYYSDVKSQLDSLFESFLPVQASRLEKVLPYIKKTDRVLEIGSGTGYFLTALRPQVTEVQGIELSAREAAYAKEVRNIPTSSLPFEESDLPKGYYDHVCLFHVLEHAADPIQFLKGLKSFIKPGGRIHLEIPNLMDPLVWIFDVEPYRNFYYQEPHLYYFKPETLSRVCEKAGYKIVKMYPFQSTSLINNLNWTFLKKPQPSRWDCMQATLPQGSLKADLPKKVEQNFNAFLNNCNKQYFKFLEENGYSDMVFATIEI